jgi:ABC-type Fe3+/spermidine/putrescine transport system ATPase subunit
MVHLELKNLTKVFDNQTAVDDLSLSIEKGEFISLLGASGCGKTTTLRMVAGFTKPTRGEIFLNGKNVTNASAKERNIGMVFQSYALFPTLTVFENICFGLRVRKKSKEQISKKVGELLELGHLEGLASRYPSQLSGGQQQRVALLRALAIEPSVLLLDEPLSNLDAKLRVDIRKEIKKMQSLLNITTMYVTHDQEEALAVSDKIAVMSQGIIQQCGTPIDIYMKPANKFVSDFIGRSNFLKGYIVEGNKLKVENEVFSLDLSEKQKIQDSVTISFRPQYVTIYDSRNPPPPDYRGITLKAKFSFEIFLGTVFQIEAITRENQVLLLEIPLEQRKNLELEKDKDLILAVPAEHIQLYDRE